MIEKTVSKERKIVLQYSKSICSSAVHHYEVARKQEYLTFDSRQ